MYVEYIGKISSLIEDPITCNLIVLGDFNAAVNTLFKSELVNMCNTHQLVVSDYEAYGRDSGQFTNADGFVLIVINTSARIITHAPCQFIYVSDAHFTTFLLDHLLCSQDIQSKLDSVKIIDKLPSSDHLPISITFIVHFQCFVSTSSSYSSSRDKLILFGLKPLLMI